MRVQSAAVDQCARLVLQLLRIGLQVLHAPMAPASTRANIGAVDVAAGEHGADHLALVLRALLQRGGKTGRAGTFGHVVGVREDRAHGLGHLGVVDLHDMVDMGAQDVQRVRLGHAAGHAVGQHGATRAPPPPGRRPASRRRWWHGG